MKNWISAILLLCITVLDEYTTATPASFSKESSGNQHSNGPKDTSKPCLIGGEPVTLEGKSSHVVAGIDSEFYLECSIEGNLSGDVFKYWNEPNGSLLVFQDKVIPDSMKSRITILNPATSMGLKVEDVMLSDNGTYKCEINGPEKLEGVASLWVDKIPDVSVKSLDKAVVENEVGDIGTCYAEAAKPAPQIWFEDSNGDPVNTYATLEKKEYGPYHLFNVSLTLRNEFSRENNGDEYFCKVEYTSQSSTKNYTKLYSLSMGKAVVNYPAYVELDPFEKNAMITMEEKQAFVATCNFGGNPSPQITWTFKPDTLYRLPNSTEPELIPEATTTLPENFYIIDDEFNSKLVSASLEITEKEKTNNGTFTCIASNGIGSDAEVSFALSITEIPTTTAPPTTPADTKENISDNPAPTLKPEPQSADAAVIGGVVAVAVFVLIVAVILLVRYFLSHKGEYYTNEIKDSVGVREGSEDEDDNSHDENDMLTNKREEYFM